MIRNLEVFQAVAGFMQSISTVVSAFQRLVRWFSGGQQGPSPVRPSSGQQGSPAASTTFGAGWQKPKPRVQEVEPDLLDRIDPIRDDDIVLGPEPLPEPAIVSGGGGGTHYRDEIPV